MVALSWAIVALLAVFAATGVSIVLHEAVRSRSRSGRKLSLPERYDRYVGRIEPGDAPLTAPLRVGAEFLAALCGFPGLGWMVSGRVKVGLPLIIIVPAAMWALFPLAVSLTGAMFPQPLAVFAILPLIAVVSAAALAVCEKRTALG